MTSPAGSSTRPKVWSVALVGNPNTGKTTVFNALTGFRQRVGNYAGVTVERKSGHLRCCCRPRDVEVELIDLPGTYSLSARSADEAVVLDVLLGRQRGERAPDVIVAVVDASHPQRNLFLASQLLEVGQPVVIALNMMDQAEAKGTRIDVAGLSRRLGVPVVPVVAHRREGIDDLARAICGSLSAEATTAPAPLPEAVEREVAELMDWGREQAGADGQPPVRMEWMQALFEAGGYHERRLQQRWGDALVAQLVQRRARLVAAGHHPSQVEAGARYQWLDRLLDEVIECPHRPRRSGSDVADRVLAHRVWGLVVFAAVLLVMFQALFTAAAPLMDAIDWLVSSLGEGVGSLLPAGALHSLVVDGVIAGVGGVLVFLPQILLLFLFVAILEDCGYLARAAFLVDRFMGVLGLSGKCVIPLLSSFACAVPGILATRTIESRRDRLITMMVAPLMSCSARLPVYVLLIAAFVPNRTVLGQWVSLPALVLLAMYLVGVVVAIPVAWVLRMTVLPGESQPFLMELPSYKWPMPATVLHRVLEQGKDFCIRAGTIIFAMSLIVWALGYYPRPASIAQSFDAQREVLQAQSAAGALSAGALDDQLAQLDRDESAAYLRQSFLGRAGRWLEPVARPLGWDWRIATAALASFPAREVIVSTLGTLYNLGGDVDDTSAALKTKLREVRDPQGRPVFNLAVALSIMVFFALCCQCAATLAVIRRESGSWAWPVGAFVYMTALAYLGAFITYQLAS